MPVESLFPIPIYWGSIDSPVVQSKFKLLRDKYVANGQLQYNKDWRNTHKISTLDFDNNLVEDENLVEFKEELAKHVSEYLRTINRDPAIEQLKVTSSWMTLYKQGDYAHQHCHGAADISGVYYVTADSNDAQFYFRSSNKAMSSSYIFNKIPEVKRFSPKTGMIILFPGWLEHAVEKQLTDQERVSVSFNLGFIRNHLLL
jgi:uncharacterized protein (TIGR02466 family)